MNKNENKLPCQKSFALTAAETKAFSTLENRITDYRREVEGTMNRMAGERFGLMRMALVNRGVDSFQTVSMSPDNETLYYLPGPPAEDKI